MIGALINAGAILVGGLIGRFTPLRLPSAWEQRLRLLLGLGAILVGFHLIWKGLFVSGFLPGLWRGVLLLIALSAGGAMGVLLGIQKRVNRAGVYARERVSGGMSGKRVPWDQAFLAGAAMFCLAPLALIGPLAEGGFADPKPQLVKSLMDGVAMIGLGRALGIGGIAVAFPVAVGQGSIALWARLAAPFVAADPVGGGIQAVAGFMVLTVALVILGTGRIRMADYLPSLILAPLLFWALA